MIDQLSNKVRWSYMVICLSSSHDLPQCCPTTM